MIPSLWLSIDHIIQLNMYFPWKNFTCQKEKIIGYFVDSL